MTIRKASVGIGAAAAAMALATAGCAGGAATQGGGGGDDEPIRIALVTPQSGSVAELGSQVRDGVLFAVEEANANGGIDGREIEVYEGDTLGTGDGAISAAQRLVQQDNAKFIVGTIATPVTLAVSQRIDAWDALLFGTTSMGVDLTGKACKAGFFRTDMNDSMNTAGLLSWLEDRGVHDWDTMGADYTLGHDAAEGLKGGLDEWGGAIDKELYAPLGTTDFGSYISQLDGGEGLLVSETGNDAVQFVKQATDFGVFDKYDLVVGNATLTSDVLDAVNSERLIGAWGTANWLPTADVPETQAFVEAYAEANGEAPREYAGAGYVAMQTLFAGVEEAGSVEPSEVRAALEGLTFTSIQGEVTMRAEDHQLEAPMYIGQVEADGDGLAFVAQESIPASVTTPEADPACTLPED
ncbi:ABC transporter substrate-binding protein [Microbacterium profundi]|uniref:ABC transporter substrate-binding protein n=1 Tax=Microbacterium profundi TaxID=450380 RepID=UPI0027DFAB20|nr:ABC transporter substrate-binding protein [Microbacterium profundi]MCE7481189.1 ABC transporter substrate-binding protein [Microbacterium profundi]